MLVGNFHFRQSLANAPYRSYKSDRSKSPRAAIFPAHTHDEGHRERHGLFLQLDWIWSKQRQRQPHRCKV